MKTNQFSFRCLTEDAAAIAIIREHLRESDPWADKSTIVRFALKIAATHVATELSAASHS